MKQPLASCSEAAGVDSGALVAGLNQVAKIWGLCTAGQETVVFCGQSAAVVEPVWTWVPATMDK